MVAIIIFLYIIVTKTFMSATFDGCPDFGDFGPRGLQSEGGVWRARCLVERNEQEKEQSWNNLTMAFHIFMLSLFLSLSICTAHGLH